MSQDPFQALYSGIGGAPLLHFTTIESIYPTVCVCSKHPMYPRNKYYGKISADYCYGFAS